MGEECSKFCVLCCGVPVPLTPVPVPDPGPVPTAGGHSSTLPGPQLSQCGSHDNIGQVQFQRLVLSTATNVLIAAPLHHPKHLLQALKMFRFVSSKGKSSSYGHIGS